MEHPWVQNLLVLLILLNAIILGLETDKGIMASFGTELILIDHVILGIFIVEIILLITARGLAYFKDPWCVFDFIVVITSTAAMAFPRLPGLSLLRLVRVVRVVKLFKQLQRCEYTHTHTHAHTHTHTYCKLGE